MALLYMVGLLAFQRYTGLLKPHQNFDWISTHFEPKSSSRMMRALLSIENSTLEGANSTNATHGGEAEADPLFPKGM